MTSNQSTAFQTANGGNLAITPAQLDFLISGTAATLIILWCVWVVLSSYRGLEGSLTLEQAGGAMLRSLFIMIITLVIVAY